MKLFYSVILIVLLSWTNACKTTLMFQVEKQIKTVSVDSLFISQSASWQAADTNQLDDNFRKDKNVKICTLEIVKLDRQSLLLITTSAIKTSDDSIFLFTPADYGGTVVSGRIKNGQIESSAKSLKGKKYSWTNDNSFRLDNKIFTPLDKTDEKRFYDALTTNHCCILTRGQDSAFIQFAGP